MKPYKSKQEIYTDLEVLAMQRKNNNFVIYDIKQLIKNYPNDKELGCAIRKYFIENNHDTDNRLSKSST